MDHEGTRVRAQLSYQFRSINSRALILQQTKGKTFERTLDKRALKENLAAMAEAATKLANHRPAAHALPALAGAGKRRRTAGRSGRKGRRVVEKHHERSCMRWRGSIQAVEAVEGRGWGSPASQVGG